VPLTLGNYLARVSLDQLTPTHAAFRDVEREIQERTSRLLAVNGSRTVDEFHMELGRICWNHCGMERSAEGLERALEEIPRLREAFWTGVRVPGSGDTLNQSLEKAGRVADFLEFAELMCRDALYRDESAGGHFRVEHQTEEGEAKRDDEPFTHVAVWEYTGLGAEPRLHKEELEFEYVPLSQRSYK
jgi:succinate dehydrogenase / fumarate reductase flavoprotein subunit